MLRSAHSRMTITGPVEARAIQRVRRRLIPFLALLYFVAYLDRFNIGFAALQMNEALGFSGGVYGFGAGIFFIAYFLFEVPSNLVLSRVGARVWLGRIAIIWGAVSMAMMFISGPRSFYVLRFLLGAAEAGFFPGVIYYFTFWFPAHERARAVAQFSMASMAAGIIGGPVSGALLSLDGRGGLQGWQWLFIVEGLPAVALGLVALRYLTDRPEDARWLPDEEKAWLIETLRRERAQSPHAHASALRTGLLDPAVWRFAAALFFIVTTGYGFSFFLPQIVRRLSGGSDLSVGLLTAIPFAAAAAAMVMVAARSDRGGERRRYVVASASVAALALFASTFATSAGLSLLLLSIAAMGIYSYTPVFWSMPTAFLRGDAAAAGIAFINAIGNLGGFLGPYLMGWFQDLSGDFLNGLRVMALAAVVSAVLIVTSRTTPVAAPARVMG
jgi:MFS transporter, ACS family, tartrate transporter